MYGTTINGYVLTFANTLQTPSKGSSTHDVSRRLLHKKLCRTLLTRLEIIAKKGIIARLSYNTSFGLYERVGKCRFFKYFWPLHKKSHAITSCTY